LVVVKPTNIILLHSGWHRLAGGWAFAFATMPVQKLKEKKK
jgi:hypothetical protein